MLAAPANAQINSTAPSTSTPAGAIGTVQTNAGLGFFGSVSLAGTDANVATTPGGAVAGNFTKFDSNGGVVDSGVPCCAGTGFGFNGPPVYPARAYPFWGIGGNQTGVAITPNQQISCYPGWVPTIRTISQLGLWFTGAGTSSYNVGIYSNSTTVNQPHALLASVAVPDTGTVPAVKYGTLSSNFQLQPNVMYWMCSQNQDTTAIASAVYQYGNLMPPMIGVASGSEQFLGQAGDAQLGQFCTLAGCPGGASSTLPSTLDGATWQLSHAPNIPFVIHWVVSAP
jgi:hypothetical protein